MDKQTEKTVLNKEEKRKRIMAILKLSLLALILIGIPVYIFFFHHDLIDSFSNMKELIRDIKGYRKESILIYMVAQALQVVICIIPGQALQFAGGYLYGMLLGLLLSLIGIAVGSCIAYFFARMLGRDAVHLFFGERKVTEMIDLMNSPKGLIVTFIIFLIPGIPKDLCSYAAGLSNIKIKPYLIVSMIARIPGMLGCLIIGSRVGAGGYTSAAVIAAIAVVLLILGIVFRQKIIDFTYKITDKLLNM
ncbi:MAG: TVP38/TMEM64 family protein [Clostridiales bacterium]|nr:TVP38/TMEM64 family protein [Clostridiales bacterium]